MGEVRRQGRLLFFVLLSCCLASPCSAESPGSAIPLTHVSITSPVSSPYYPVVLKGDDLPSLLDVPIERIALYAGLAKGLQPIPFQIDRRDGKGRFEIPKNRQEQAEEGRYPFDGNDECVFMAADTGEKSEAFPQVPGLAAISEIEITDSKSGRQGWVYALVFNPQAPRKSPEDYVSYRHEEDAVESETYRVAFSRDRPFLVDTLQWKEPETGRWSPDLADTMKVRHTGKLFHRFDFVRTQDDYSSRVLGVKDGPVRVIRSTANRVRIIWQLRTPSISIDYICYANSFCMDAVVDIPFRIGWFFSGVDTLMTLDGNDDPSLPQSSILSASVLNGSIMDGKMSEEEEALNASGDSDLIISNAYGKILVSMALEKDLPVQYRVYVMDDRNAADPPEDIPGQFGNAGFFTTGWEKMDTSVHHMIFRTYMIRDISVEQAFKILKGSPLLVN